MASLLGGTEAPCVRGPQARASEALSYGRCFVSASVTNHLAEHSMDTLGGGWAQQVAMRCWHLKGVPSPEDALQEGSTGS
jgi:hypothetical protein